MSARARVEKTEQRELWGEGRGDRLELAREAGWGQVSWYGVAAGVLTALGVVTVCVGVAAAVLPALDLTTGTLTDGEWTRLGLGAAVVAALVLIGGFALGGYTAGRMARRAGLRHGVLVLVVGVVAIAAAIGIAALEGAGSAARDRLADLGVPTGDSSWGGIALLTAGVALVGALTGSLLGGVRGERWHERLVARALDPDVGPEADLRAEAEAQRRSAAKALERARKAGVVPADATTDGVTATQDEPTGAMALGGADDDGSGEPASTGAAPSTPPSSWSSGP